MLTSCTSTNELSKALADKQSYIEIEGDLANKIIRIKIVGKLAWAVCFGSLTIAVGLYIATPQAALVTAPAGGTGGAVTFTGALVASGAAATALGPATGAAIALGIPSGGVGVLTVLRNQYKIVDKKNGYVKLERK